MRFKVLAVAAAVAALSSQANAATYRIAITGLASEIRQVTVKEGKAKIVERSQKRLEVDVTVPDGVCVTRVRLHLDDSQVLDANDVNVCESQEISLQS